MNIKALFACIFVSGLISAGCGDRITEVTGKESSRPAPQTALTDNVSLPNSETACFVNDQPSVCPDVRDESGKPVLPKAPHQPK